MLLKAVLKVLGRLFLSELIPKIENNGIYIQSDKRYFGYRREKIAFNNPFFFLKEKKFGNKGLKKSGSGFVKEIEFFKFFAAP